MKYNDAMIKMHWLMGGLFIGALVIGYIMVEFIPGHSSLKPVLYDVHKQFGLLIFLLAFLRLAIRRVSPIPELPTKISNQEKFLAKTMHFLLYGCMILMPLSGLLMTAYSGRTIDFFGLKLFNFLGTNHQLAAQYHYIHINMMYLVALLVTLHIGGAVKHYYMDKIDLFKRIM